MRALIVVQRYGQEIIGGAEAHARILAEKLHTAYGWEVTVLTSAAKSYITWANEYPAGETKLNGITVKRFKAWFPRVPGFGLISRILLKLRRGTERWQWNGLSRGLEKIWVILQGPFVPGLIKHIKKQSGRYDLTIFFTYLYYPTVFGMRAAKNKTVFVPTAHDEAPFYFHLTREVFLRAQHVLANSESESELIKRITPQAKALAIAGLGIDTTALSGGATKGNYVLYLGRLSRGKGVDKLIEWFKRADPKSQLFLAGVKEAGVEWGDDPRIRYLGVLSDTEKIDYIRKARVMVNPSPLESLSLIVLEAAAACVPVLVNRQCEVFRYYEKEMPTVFGFEGFEEFREALHKASNMDWTSAEGLSSLEKSRRWVQDRYSWEAVLNKFKAVAASEG